MDNGQDGQDTYVLDQERWRELHPYSALDCNLWLKVLVASDTGDKPEAHLACETIASLTKAAFALVKAIGSPDPNAGLTQAAVDWRAVREMGRTWEYITPDMPEPKGLKRDVAGK